MEDQLENFKNWYIAQKLIIRLCVPFDNPLMFIDGISGLTLYRENNFQVQLFSEPNRLIWYEIYSLWKNNY